jgi:type 1 fimbria pilin
MNIPNMTIPRDAAIGAEIGSTIITPPIDAFSCTTGFKYQEFGVKGYGSSAQKINDLNIYKLGPSNSGIGYAIYGNSVGTCQDYKPIDGNTSTGNINNKILCNINGTFMAPIRGSVKIVFYKIGNIAPARIPEQNVGSFILRNNQNLWHWPESYLKTTSFTVSTHGCSINSTSIQVPLGEIGMTKLGNLGITAAEKDFLIPLNCDAGTKIKLTLTPGAAGVYDDTKGLLNLTNPASPGTAKGVKIQVLSNAVPVKFEKSLDTGTQTSTGTFNIPLQARYYRSIETLKAGAADTTITYTVTYE